LGTGNYLNGGSAKGQAYGVKIDVLKKLPNLKANNPAYGSLLNFVAHEAINHAPEITKFSGDWNAFWLASELSLSQLDVEIKQAERDVEKVKAEYKLATRSGTENDVVEKALALRAKNFLAVAESRIAEIKSELKTTNDLIGAIVSKFGKNCTATDFGEESDDISKAFFNLFVNFARSFQNAFAENENMRRDIEKASERAARAGEVDKGSSKYSKAPASAAPEENIFGNFQKSQGKGASADQLILDFKRKLQAKFHAASASKEEDDGF